MVLTDSAIGRTSAATAVRPEIQALRAAAVLAVVVYHLWPTRLPGGYVGVDVFFVISGFLITAHLLRELERTGRVGLASFYARRARRLLPAALTVLLVTAIGTALLMPVREWGQVATELIGAVFYVENWVLASDSVDYLAQAQGVVSPVQHFWSLSVEEQFYLVWPLLLLAGWRAAIVTARRRGRVLSPRTCILLVLSVVLVASLVVSIVSTAREPGPAYFGTHVRAWEFAAGGLLAALGTEVRGERIRSGVAWAGWAGIVIACVTYTAATPFPGWTAALPVVATLAVISAGSPTLPWSPTRIASLRPVGALGDVSYSLYLWHWPLVVLVPYALGRDLDLAARLAILVSGIVLAVATKRWIEDPARQHSALVRRRPRATAAAVVIAMVPVLVSAGALQFTSSSIIRADQDRAEALIAGDLPCFGAAALTDEGCDPDALTGPLIPSVDAAPQDDVNTPECWSTSDEDELKVCRRGPDDGSVRIALVGDSHSNQYLAAVERIAEDRGWTVDVMGKTGCIWTAAVQVNSPAWVESCESWKGALNDHLLTTEPYDAVLTSSSAESEIRAREGSSVAESTVDGFVDAWSSVTARGTPVLAIKDNPHARDDYLTCIATEGGSAPERCSVSEDEGFRFFDGQPGAVDETPGARLIDLTPYFCPADRCSPVIGGVIVYRDPSHISSTYARTLATALADLVESHIADGAA